MQHRRRCELDTELISKFTERPGSRYPPIPLDELQPVQAHLEPGGSAESSLG
jgi:hypothetical protein